MAGLLKYSEGTTLLHRANPLSKVLLALCICVAVFLAPHSFALLAIIGVEVLIGLYAGIGKETLSLLTGLLGLGLIMCLVQLLIIRDGTAIFLFVTDRGLSTGVLVALRLVAFAIPLVQMLTLTRLTDLANAAVRVLHVPYRYAFTITTALRFVPIFADEMNKIVEAQTARGASFDEGGIFRRLRLMLPLAAPLLISSVAKADNTALAAEERGFYLRTRSSSYKRYPFGVADIVVFAVGVLIVAASILW